MPGCKCHWVNRKRWVPAPQIGEMFVKSASRQHHKVYARLTTSTFSKLSPRLQLNNFHEIPQSFTGNVCLESKRRPICFFSETTRPKSQSQENTGIVDTLLSTNIDFDRKHHLFVLCKLLCTYIYHNLLKKLPIWVEYV